MKLDDRIEAFAKLGEVISDGLGGNNAGYGAKFSAAINKQHLINPWFTPENVRMALAAIAEKLTRENLHRWVSRYPALSEKHMPVNVGVIMAGNIPLVGFHDFLCVMITGNRIVAKPSSKDSGLIKLLAEILCSVRREFEEMIIFKDDNLSGFDMIIATGSNNSARYFEYYFGRYPGIIRKSRNSVAIIGGNESEEEFRKLGVDVFSYFGLGCRNVSKIYIPRRFDIKKITGCWEDFSPVINHSKYANNYEYNLAVLMVNREKFTDTGFLILKESYNLSSPVAVLHYQYYDSIDEVQMDIQSQSTNIQCIISNNMIPFGMSQKPELWDYSDNIDTIDFLLKKNLPGIL